MCFSMWVPVGASKAPMAIEIESCSIGSQNSEAPQVEQNPRWTLSEERNQATLNSPSILSALRGTSVDTQKWPEVFRHWVQWQASGGFSSPSTSNFTAPQRQDPVSMVHSSQVLHHSSQ